VQTVRMATPLLVSREREEGWSNGSELPWLREGAGLFRREWRNETEEQSCRLFTAFAWCCPQGWMVKLVTEQWLWWLPVW